jgi:uncharacterized protein (DUF305 family)
MQTNKLIYMVIVLQIICIAFCAICFIQMNPMQTKKGMSGMHQMPDGTMMANNGNTMASMMHDMNASLAGKTGDAFDTAFLSEMIVHHQGAVEMAQSVLKTSKRPELITLAKNIISAQNAEIKMMQDWQGTWFNN